MLQAVIERHRRAAAPKAWLAKWHVLTAVQGASQDPAGSHMRAVECADRALNAEEGNGLALAVKGHALCHLGRSLAESLATLDAAVAANPNEASAWLYRSVWQHMWGTPEAALNDARVAIELSPLDPQRAHFDLILGNAYLAAGDLAHAIETLNASVKRNQCHLPALRALLTAQHEAGLELSARETLSRVMQLTPNLTVAGFLATGSSSPFRKRVAQALKDLGVPRQSSF